MLIATYKLEKKAKSLALNLKVILSSIILTNVVILQND
jgi:hypothetical protein